ncbi:MULTISPECIES: hypothetical protein [Paenibacillus]|uniref:Uncharacterized protein n=1 Tax=Paenibacillus pabuli TaxID=1472 RepID=A0A855Y499_9BACL|nr:MULTISPECIES: hypothetical protein [Paenibacillus]PWW43817.1 hypothetical protein DET56_10243 [Paenibacillus pabuli]PXW09846.1 hypothetical protein DEU73_10243 [Paenibacillus taichungensis]
MAGTKMRLQRYGGEVTHRHEQEIIVDQNFLDTNNGLYITLTHPYVMGSNMLDVYYNGQRLSEGGGYEEIDPNTIRLDLGVYPPIHKQAGQPVPLFIGDEIYITAWKAEYLQSGGNIDTLRFLALEEEIIEARKFNSTDTPFNRLDDRLDYIQDRATLRAIVLVLPKVKLGATDFDVPAPFSGKVSHVLAKLGTAGTEDTVVKVERCITANLENPAWTNILSTDITIEAGNRASKSSQQQPVVSVTDVSVNDSYRLYVDKVGAGAKGLVVEIVIYT